MTEDLRFWRRLTCCPRWYPAGKGTVPKGRQRTWYHSDTAIQRLKYSLQLTYLLTYLRADNLALHRDSIPDRPTRSQSLCRLSYPAHNVYIYIYIYIIVSAPVTHVTVTLDFMPNYHLPLFMHVITPFLNNQAPRARHKLNPNRWLFTRYTSCAVEGVSGLAGHCAVPLTFALWPNNP